jgi:hypothetical protein
MWTQRRSRPSTADLAGGFEADFDGLFELGLSALLDGFGSIVERAK